MIPIQRFSLEKHVGPYEAWPRKTRLAFDGKPTQLQLPGYNLGWQFQVGDDFLLVIDHDCPFDEQYDVVLLSARLRIRSQASDPRGLFAGLAILMGALEVSAANLYDGYEVLDARTVRLTGCTKPPHLRIHVRERRPLGFGSLLELRVEHAQRPSP